MPDYDETKGWIFSDGYHRWQDKAPATGSRFSGEINAQAYGWASGLYGFKIESESVLTGISFKSACWPVPQIEYDLDEGGSR